MSLYSQNFKNKEATIDLSEKKHYSDYIFDLPYKKGKSYRVIQGYNGDFSHQDKFALDFEMPVGTEVLAVREGLVINIVQQNNIGCASKDCAKYANYISILHSDETIADYYHLSYQGAKVKVGDKIKKGDVIGLSGNTGWSSIPHLHFVCYSPSKIGAKKEISIKTLFKTGNGKRIEYLIEGKRYLKDY